MPGKVLLLALSAPPALHKLSSHVFALPEGIIPKSLLLSGFGSSLYVSGFIPFNHKHVAFLLFSLAAEINVGDGYNCIITLIYGDVKGMANENTEREPPEHMEKRFSMPCIWRT